MTRNPDTDEQPTANPTGPPPPVTIHADFTIEGLTKAIDTLTHTRDILIEQENQTS